MPSFFSFEKLHLMSFMASLQENHAGPRQVSCNLLPSALQQRSNPLI